MDRDDSESPPRKRRARPLLLAAAGAVSLLLPGCKQMTSGNLIAYFVDMAGQPPPDLQPAPDLRQPAGDLATPPDGGAHD